MSAITYRTQHGDVLDDLCWRHYGYSSGTLEAVLDANPGLAARGPIYPDGILIVFPEIPAAASPRVQGPVRLWE